MKNSSDSIGNRNRDLQTCSTVPQPTAPPRAPGVRGNLLYVHFGDTRFEYRQGYSAILRGLFCLSKILTNKTRHISLNRPRPLRPISSPFPVITLCYLYHSDGPILCPSSSTKCLQTRFVNPSKRQAKTALVRIATVADYLRDYGIPFFPPHLFSRQVYVGKVDASFLPRRDGS